jgi:hypothetical protein
MFSMTSRTRINHLQGTLNNTKKGDLTVAQFFAKMREFSSELAAAGKPVEDDEMIGYVLNGLDSSYNELVSSVNGNPNTTFDDLFSLIKAHDLCRDMLAKSGHEVAYISSTNVADCRGRDDRPHGERGRTPPRAHSPDRGNRGYCGDRGDRRADRYGNDHRDGGHTRRYDDGGQGRRRDDQWRHDDGRQGRCRYDDGTRPRRDDGGRHRDEGGQGRRRYQGRAPTPFVDITCQICKIHGHPASDCWWRYEDHSDYDDDDVKGDDKQKGALVSYGVDTNWYTDSGATRHLTSRLNKLSVHKYKGQDQVHTADGNDMHISHIGNSILRTPHDSLQLKNTLHVRNALKNLLSVHKLALDNNVFLEFNPFFFFIKDRVIRRTLFKGACTGGLFPLVLVTYGSSRHAFVTVKPSSSTWHRRLGYPSSFVVQQVLRKNNILFTPEINLYVCDSCQLAKSHQLPYPISTSVSIVPLEQVFSDVWGSTPVSFNKHAYYVSFIDDFSKFT